MAVLNSAGDELVFIQELLSVTSTRVGSDVLDVLFEARSDGAIPRCIRRADRCRQHRLA
ncbi:hypothetical protein ABZS71_06435 [Streptomyces sp. NPDC005393]|uniref:hypothetical protein n=1 Tax=Streptomyces sp. NPDC005393 TaxID=3157041 RepID=UPI0033B04170